MSTFVNYRTTWSTEIWTTAWPHVSYLQNRRGNDLARGEMRPIFDKTRDSISFSDAIDKIQLIPETKTINTYLEFLLAPNTFPDDVVLYTRYVFSLLDQVNLDWFAVAHHHSKHPHVHAIIAPMTQGHRKKLISTELLHELRQQSDYYLFCRD